jgi:hypothetical protein
MIPPGIDGTPAWLHSPGRSAGAADQAARSRLPRIDKVPYRSAAAALRPRSRHCICNQGLRGFGRATDREITP